MTRKEQQHLLKQREREREREGLLFYYSLVSTTARNKSFFFTLLRMGGVLKCPTFLKSSSVFVTKQFTHNAHFSLSNERNGERERVRENTVCCYTL